jgi:hypothetical protein
MKNSEGDYLRKYFVGVLVLLSQLGIAQVSESFSFLGMLQSSDRQVMTYKIDLTILDGIVSGTSLMGIDGPNATTSNIVGTYDYDTKELCFAEDKILSSKAPLDGDFCFISIKATMAVKKKKSHLNGDFWGLVDKKDSCVVGQINMVATSYIMKKMATLDKAVKKSGIKDSIALANADLATFEKSISTQRISDTESVSIKADGEKCLLKVWDEGMIDGDVVSVKLNGVLVLHDYILKRDMRVIGLLLSKGENTIEIVAQNTGSRFPNTASLSFEDSTSITKLSSNLEKDQSAVIKVVR